MPAAKVFIQKQKKLLKLITENVGLEKPKTLYQMFLESGYEENTAKQQTNIMAGLQDKLDPIVQAMEDHRGKVIKQYLKGWTKLLPKQ